MKAILLLSILAFAMSNRDLLVELEASAKPLPVVKCLIESDKIRKDVVVVVDAVKQFLEDKNAFLLLTKILGVYAEVEAEVKRCLKQEGVNLQNFIRNLPQVLKKIWDSLPSSTKSQILEAIAKKGRQAAKILCNKILKKKEHKKICSYI